MVRNITDCFDSIDNEFGIDTNTTPDPSTSAIVPVNEVIEVPAYECTNARESFEAAYANEHYQISYDEVASLVNTTLVDHMYSPTQDGTLTSIAEGLLGIFGTKVKEFEVKPHWSAKQTAQRRAFHEKKEAVRTEFVNKWQDRLGYVGGWCEVTDSFVREANSKVADNPLLASVQYSASYDLIENAPKRFGNKSNRKVLSASKGLPVVNNLGQLVLAILVRACKNLTSLEKVDLIADLDSLKKNPQIKKTTDNLGVIIEDFVFSLGDATIGRINSINDGKVVLGRSQKAIKVVMFDRNFVVDGVDAVFVWMLNSMRLSSQGLAQAINLSSNFFEEVVNYGQKPGPLDIAWHVNQNMLKQAKISTANVTHFPYSNLSNNKLETNTLDFVLSKGIHAICDKQNKSWITINSGAEALFVGRDEDGYLINLNDMGKATKLFNRPAANRYSFAEIL